MFIVSKLPSGEELSINLIHIKPKRDQQGLASFIVVFTLVILISLVSVGFSKLMDRAINNASNNQLRYAAEYAAQSGLNDAVALIKTGAVLPINSDTNCNSLAGTGGLLAGKSNITTRSEERRVGKEC